MGRRRWYGPPWPDAATFGPAHWHGGRRMRRGEIRIALLAVLAEGPGHGYDLIGRLEAKTHGVWRPSPGSVYPTLQLLEDEGVVRSEQREGKRVYELTETGRELAAGTTAPWTAVAGESEDALIALRDLAHQVLAATRQVAHAGTAAQLEAAQPILRDARKSLYRLLADELLVLELLQRRVDGAWARAPDAARPLGQLLDDLVAVHRLLREEHEDRCADVAPAGARAEAAAASEVPVAASPLAAARHEVDAVAAAAAALDDVCRHVILLFLLSRDIS